MNQSQESLLNFVLIHADNSLILSQRLSEWCGHGPILEQDIAMTNIALDYLGRARLLYQFATSLDPHQRNEDQFAYLRDVLDYKNVLLVEQENKDFAYTIVRQFFMDSFNEIFYRKLKQSKVERLNEIAEKSWKESNYHLKWSSDWMLRLGDGTEISHQKTQNAINFLWPFTGELFQYNQDELYAVKHNNTPSSESIKKEWDEKVNYIFTLSNLKIPEQIWMQKGGKQGIHTEYLGYILSDLQFMQRAYPGMEW